MKKAIVIMVVFYSVVLVCMLFAQEQEKVVAQKGVTLKADKQKQNKDQVNPTAYGHSAVLTWTAPTTCADGSPCTATSFNIYKAQTACPSGTTVSGATKIASVPSSTTTYTDSNITAPGSYCWYVTAVNANGESTASNAAGGSLTQPLLAAPTNFTVTAQ
jgi:hypothetical protein